MPNPSSTSACTRAPGRPARRAVRLLLLTASILQAPAAVRAGSSSESRSIDWLSDDASGLALARTTGRLVLVDFWADWCEACAVMEHLTFSDPRVSAEVGRLVAVRLDGSDGSAALLSGRFQRAAERWRLGGLPTLLLLDGRGRLLDRIEGVVQPRELLARIGAARARCRAELACR